MPQAHEQRIIYSGLNAQWRGKLKKLPPLPNDSTERWDNIPEEITYSVYVDLTMVHDMALKAAANKSGQSRDGALLVRVTKRKPLARR